MLEKLKEFLRSRRRAYLTVFNPDSIDVKIVLKDLASFCRANHSTFLPDARAHAVLEGRREVFLRISNHLRLSPEELWRIYGRVEVE